MVGTILKDDLQSAIEDQLQQYASGLGQAGQQVGDTWADLQRAGRTKIQDVQAQLSDYATQAYNQAQEAQRQAAARAQDVQSQLSDYATQLTSGGQPQAAQQPNVAGVPTAALPHNEEPGTAGDQVGAGGAAGWKTQFDFGQTYTGDYRTGTPHRGVDVVPSNGGGIGTEVDAFAPGTVSNIFRDPGGAGGLIVYVQDADGLTHAYMHLNSVAAGLQVGQHVDRGTPIATMGESGTEGSPHLHYEVRKNAASGDPLDQLIDPRPYLAGSKQPSGGQAQGPVQAAQQAAQQAVTTIGQGKDAFLSSLAPLAKQFSDTTGIDPAVFLGIAGHETGWGTSSNAQQLNNLFSIQGSNAGGRWAGYDSPAAAFQGFVDLISSAPRYAQAWADRADPYKFIDDLRQAGYVADEPGFPAQTWVDATKRNIADLSQNPIVAGAVSTAANAIPGVAGARRAAGTVMQAGEAVAGAKPVYGTLQDAAAGARQQLQTIQDQVDQLRQSLEQYNQPPLAAGAQQAVTGAVGGAFNELGTAANRTYEQLYGTPAERQARSAQYQQDVIAAGQAMERRAQNYGPGELAQDVWSNIIGANPSQGITWDQYQQTQAAKNKWIEDNNPFRDWTVLGGLTTGIAQQLTDPLQVLAFGPTFGAGRALGAGVGEAVAGRLGGVMAPRAVEFVSGVAEKLTSGALANGIQNATFEAERPDATPESVGQAFASGAALGGIIDVGSMPVSAALRSIGGRILDNLPEIQRALRSRQPAQAEVGFALGMPTGGEPPRAAEPATPPRPSDITVEPRFPGVTRVPSEPPAGQVAGVQRLPGYAPPGSPEAGFEALARASREASPDGRAHIDLNTVSQDILPFDRNAAPGQGQIVKLNPGGMPSLDDLRALYEANQHKRSFYTDQGDAAANIVGKDNIGEFFTNGSITSMGTPVARQVAEAIQIAGLVRQVARDGREANLPTDQIRQNILDALNDPAQNPLAGKTGPNKRKAILEGYSTGEAPVSSGAKTSSFAGNYASAEGRFFDPRVTNDIHNWRIMNVSSDEIPSLRVDKKTGEGVWFYDRPFEKNAANNDRAYRGVEAVWNELAKEYGVDGYALQSAMWDGMRAMQLRDPVANRMWQQGMFRQAIERAQRNGVFRLPTDVTNDPGDIQRVLNSEPVQRQLARWGDVLKDPLPPELGIGDTVQRTFAGKRLGVGKAAPAAKPSNLAFREEQRVGAEASAPLVNGLDRETANQLGYDPQRGIFPWLEASHRVVEVAPDEYVVHLPAGNEDTARYVAAQVGQAANADTTRIHVPDYRSSDVIGVSARGTPDEIAALQHALDNQGITSIVGTGKRSLQVPYRAVGDQQTSNAVQDAAMSIGFPHEGLAEYTGRTADVTRSEYAPTSGRLAATFAPTTAERSALLQRGLGAVPEGRGPPDILRGRQPAQANVPFAANIAGAALGGYAGSAATPESATPEERLRNIGLGAAAGFAAGHLATRIPLRPVAERVGGPTEAFRAPERPAAPELRATTQEPPGGPGERPPTTVGGGVPRNLEQVHSNPYALREAQAHETPMTGDEMLSYADELEQRMQDVQNQRDAIDEMIRNPGQKIDRPRWAAGLTNLQVAEIARRAGASPYEEGWYERVGLEQGSGEVRDVLRESGITDIPALRAKEPSPAQLRAERTRLDREVQDISDAYGQMTNAPAEPNLVRVRAAGETTPSALPFDTGAPAEPTPATPAEAGGGMDEGARLAQEIVLSKGRGTLRSDQGQVSLEGNVRATGLVSHEAIQQATSTPVSARTEANMPNLNAMLKGEPEIAAQIRRAAEDNPDLFEAYRQGTISMDSLRNDLAKRVGMTVQDWNKTKIGQGFNEREMVALQAAAIEQQGRMTDMASSILARGGVDNLSPEELVFSAATLADATKVLAVARGARTTAGRTLNALKQQFDRTMASDITASNERLAAQKLGAQARRAAARATAVLAKGRELEQSATAAKAMVSRYSGPEVPLTGLAQTSLEGMPSPRARGSILQQIEDAYAQLDRYNAMSLHEKGAEFDRLKAERAANAAKRKSAIQQGVPEQLLSALKAELKAEQDNFARRKDTWETMAFWDSKAAENAMTARTAFRGQLYIEQQRKLANIAAKDAEREQARAFDAELQRRTNQSAKAEKLLQSIGGRDVTKQVLSDFVQAMNDPAPDAAAKFLKGMAKPSNWARATTIRLAGLLSGPITHMANMGGNVARAMVEVPVRATTVGIDALRSAITGGERQAYMGELMPMMQAYAPGFYAQLPEAVNILKTGISQREAADLSKVRAGFGSGNQVVDAAVEMPLRLLGASDALFRGAAYAAHANRVATREAIKEGFTGDAIKGRAATIVRNLEEYPDLAKEVEDNAAHMVFQEHRNLPIPRQMPGATIEQSELGRFARTQVLPFVETPANITAQGFGMSPLGFVSAYEAARGVAGKPVATRAERYARGRQVLLAEERAARALVGTGIFGAGLALGAAGLLTAAYSEDPAVNSTYPQGWRPWSFRLTDPVSKNTYYIPLQNLAGVGAPLAMAAIMTDPTHHGKTIMDPEEFGMAATGIGKYVLDNTFLQGMSDFVDLLQDPNHRGSKFLESLAASYGPYSAMGREMQRAFGVATRNPREGVRGLIDAMAANYPGVSGTVPPSLTPIGEERTQIAGLQRYMVPGRYDLERDEPTLQTLRQYGAAIPKVDRSISINNGSYPLNEDERSQLTQAQGQLIRQMVADAQRDPRWARYTDADKAAAIKNVVSAAARGARLQFIADQGDAEYTRRWTPRPAAEPYYLGAPGP